ncbi:MAG TPA: hypothetical protein VGZ91_19970 [Candidatus Sulfotelmatobacter sp.]|jgi:hypothetical protein|nr:hypothetical protein [Candidatus Sulfotelmatobacter sp.]
MNTESKSPEPTPPELVLTEEVRKRVILEERLKAISKATKFRGLMSGLSVLCFLAIVGIAIYLRVEGLPFSGDYLLLFLLPIGVFVYVGGLVWAVGFLRNFTRQKLQQQLEAIKVTQKTEQLQENLDDNFFTNLVKINFKYIDQYYLQTQLQANKSFSLCAIAAITSLLVILTGVGMLFVRQNAKDAGYVATGAGVLGEFIASVFFYLYNRTILKMGEYHQKLVLTQNVSLALKISEDLPAAEQVVARSKLIDYLSKDINTFLTAGPSERTES